MVTVCSTETLVSAYNSTWHYKPEDQRCLEDMLQDEHWKYKEDLADRLHVVGA
jgi:hypothetical protein